MILPIDDFVANENLSNSNLDTDDFIQSPYWDSRLSRGKQYGFINWNYNMVYWARADLLNDEGERAAFKEKYGYDLAPAQTLEQLRDIAEFFTRKSGETLKGEILTSDFYGIVLEGLKGWTSLQTYFENLLRNYGGDIIDENGKPSFNTPEVVESLKLWAELWKYSPPGTAEYSLIDVPTVMGNGIAAQTLAWSDFVLGIDKPGASPLHGQFVYAPVPVKEGADPKFHAAAGEPSLIVISRASKNPGATFLFLQWLGEKRPQAALLEAGSGGVPIRDSSWPGMVALLKDKPTLVTAMQGSLERVSAKKPMPQFFQITDALADLIQKVGLGTMTPEEAAARGQEAMESSAAIAACCNRPDRSGGARWRHRPYRWERSESPAETHQVCRQFSVPHTGMENGLHPA